MKRIETPLRDPKSIFACDWCLREIMTKLQKYLNAKLPYKNGTYYCYYEEEWDDYESDWHFTEEFRDKMGIAIGFLQMLIEPLDYANNEAEFLNKFSVEDIIEQVRQNREENRI